MLWMDQLGFFGSLLIAIVLCLSFLILGCCLIWHVAFGIKERFKNRNRSIITAVLMIVVAVAYFQPFGLLTPDRFEGKDLLIAQREGSANCTTVFKLKENNRFVEETVCFGIARIKGEYRLKDDTVYFHNVEGSKESYYQFAVIQKSVASESGLGTLVRYKNAADSAATSLWIVINNLH
jgi:hypothetical protein